MKEEYSYTKVRDRVEKKRNFFMQKNKFIKLASRITAAATIVSMFAMVSPAMAGTITSMTDTMTRQKVSANSAHAIAMTLQTGEVAATTMTLTFANNGGTDFDFSGSAITDGGGSCSLIALSGTNLGVITVTLGADCSSANETVLINVDTATNSDTAGSHKVTIASRSNAGTLAVALTAEDQIGVTATVDPTITFDAGATTAPCDRNFVSSNYAVELGTLSLGAVTSSDAAGIKHICTRLSSNASSGTVVRLKDANAGLHSAATGHTIPATFGFSTMAVGAEGYAVCLYNVIVDAATPTSEMYGSGFDFGSLYSSGTEDDSPYCTGTLHHIGTEIGTNAVNILDTGGSAVANGVATVLVKAGISSTTAAANDYTDTLTFIATGTF